jgi:hypothetical protein
LPESRASHFNSHETILQSSIFGPDGGCSRSDMTPKLSRMQVLPFRYHGMGTLGTASGEGSKDAPPDRQKSALVLGLLLRKAEADGVVARIHVDELARDAARHVRNQEGGSIADFVRAHVAVKSGTIFRDR